MQQQSIVLAQVANSFKESAEKTRDKLGEQNADLKKFQTSVIDALKSHSHRIERIEGAIEGLHRLLVAQMGGLPYHAETGEDTAGGVGFGPASDPYLAKAKDDLRLGGGRTRVSPGRGGTRRLRRRGAQRRRRGRRQRSKAQVRRGRVGERQAGVEVVAAAAAAAGYEAARLRRAL